MKQTRTIKGVFLVVLMVGFVFFTACSAGKYFDPNYLNKVNFNNRFVDYINEVGQKVNDSFQKYETVVSDITKKNAKIDFGPMDLVVKDMEKLSEDSKDLKKIKSRDENQEKKVQEEFDKYMKGFSSYLVLYKEVNLFYSAKEYGKDANQANSYNQKLTAEFENFISVHGNFAEKVLPFFADK